MLEQNTRRFNAIMIISVPDGNLPWSWTLDVQSGSSVGGRLFANHRG
jgi:hypothetical protein